MTSFDAVMDRCPVLRKLRYPALASHRGGSATFGPENTLYNYRRCVNEVGTDILEIDIRKTADNQYVIMHDWSVNRTTNGRGMVSQLSFAEIRALDAAYNWSPDGGKTFPLRGKGITVPSMDEVLAEFSTHEQLVIFFDMKAEGCAEAVFAAIEKYGLQHRCIIGAVPPGVNAEVMALKPSYIPATPDIKSMLKLYMSYLGGCLSKNPLLDRFELLGWAVPPGNVLRRLLSPKFVKAMHDCGKMIAVFGGFLDTTEGQLLCLSHGVDILVTDRPDLLKMNLAPYRGSGSGGVTPAAVPLEEPEPSPSEAVELLSSVLGELGGGGSSEPAASESS